MKRGKAHRGRRAAPDATDAGPADPARVASEGGPSAGPATTRDPAQTDIERAGEHRPGSVESLPPRADSSGFIEAADEATPAEATPPYLQEE